MGFFDPFGGSGSSGGSGGTIVPGNYATKAELTSEAEKRASADKELQTEIKANAESVSGLEKSVEELQTSKANASDVYTKTETDSAITAKVSEIVADAPEDFNTLKEMSDWLTEHEDSAAAMNTAIQTNTKAIADNATAIEGNITDIEQNKNDIAVNRNTLGTQCKNIINNNRTSGTSGGLTITVNEDKSITFNGTATENVYYWVYGTGVSTSNQKKLPRGIYVLTGCPKDGTQETYSLAIGYRQSSTSDRYAGYDIGNGYKLNMNSDTGSVDILIQIRTGTIVDNLTFYPMLRPADITDNTYEPYIPSVAEQLGQTKSDILSAKNDIAINRATLGTQRKNLFNKDGEINLLYNGTVVTTGTNIVEGNVITFNRATAIEHSSGQFISGLAGQKVVITGNCLSTGTSSSGFGAMIMYKRNETTFYNRKGFGTGTFTYTIDCGDTDEWLFAFAVNGSGSGLQIENLMIRLADITDDTYESYIPSVAEQIEQNKNDILNTEKAIAINRSTLGTQRVNIFDGELKKGNINPETGNNLDNDSAVITKNYIAVTPNAIISISRTENSGYMAWRFYDENKNYLGVANSSNIKLIHGGNVSNILTQQRNFGCFKLINPEIKYMRFRDMTNSLSNVYTIVEGEYTEDTMPVYEPYVPSINERLTANENDILSTQNQIKNQTLITSSGDMSSVNWYRVFEADRKTSARNGLLMISRGFSNGIPESYILAFQMGFYSTDFKFNLVTKLNEDASAYIDKVRVVFKNDDSASSNKCYIDIHYNLDKSNTAYISILGTSNAVNFPFKAVDFSAAEIPEGYTSYEFDLTGKDVFDRLTSLEAALAQTTTASE